MTNRKTQEANHNKTQTDELLKAFRLSRAKTVGEFEQLDESDWGKAAFHERLQEPMRITDTERVTGEHDDCHVARIHRLVQTRILILNLFRIVRVKQIRRTSCSMLTRN